MDITEMDVSTFLEKEELGEYHKKLAENAEAFVASCGKEPLEVYRIEKFVPTLQSKESHGKFFQGDSYVVVKQEEAEYNIHYWHGNECTSDEMGSSAAFSVQLSSKLPKQSHHHLEEQGFESEEFTSYFKSLEYLRGGIESGFNYIEEKTVEKPKLMRIMGNKNARVFEVDCKADSINDGDVFVLEAPSKLFYWEGTQSNPAERGKAFSYVQSMRRYERHCGSEIVYPQEEDQMDEEFWKILGGKPAQIKPAVDDKVAATQEEVLKYSLWMVKQDGSKVNLSEVKERPLKKDMLDSTNVYILETFNKVQIWIGKEADLAEKKNSLIIGKGFVKQHNKVKGTRVLRICEDTEDQFFKSYFNGFCTPATSKLGEDDQHKVKIEEIANKKREVVANLLTKLGSKYTVKVYLCKDGKNIELPEEQHGHFFQDEVYVIDVQGENHRYLIQWIGPKLPPDEIAEIKDYMAQLTDYVYTPNTVTRLSVQQGHEDDTVLKFFSNGFVCHDGPHLDMNALNEKLTSKGAMFRVMGPFDETPQAIMQDDLICQNLNSNEAFFVIKPNSNKSAFAWFGTGCSAGERMYCERLEKILNCSSCTHFAETEESDDFWATLGGKTEYSSTKVLGFAPGFEPRMFQITVAGGYSLMDEIKNFQQTDLNNNDVMIIDAYMTIWVWTGNKSNKFEHKAATKRIGEYKAALTDGRDIKNVQVSFVEPCNEPFNFKGLFPEWEDEVSATWTQEREAAAAPIAEQEEKKQSDAKYLDPKTNKFELDVLKNSFPEGVPPNKKQDYLNDEDFQSCFNMTRRDFAELKEWKQAKLKKAVGLF